MFSENSRELAATEDAASEYRQSEDDSSDYLFSVGGDTGAAKSSGVWLVDSGAT